MMKGMGRKSSANLRRTAATIDNVGRVKQQSFLKNHLKVYNSKSYAF